MLSHFYIKNYALILIWEMTAFLGNRLSIYLSSVGYCLSILSLSIRVALDMTFDLEPISNSFLYEWTYIINIMIKLKIVKYLNSEQNNLLECFKFDNYWSEGFKNWEVCYWEYDWFNMNFNFKIMKATLLRAYKINYILTSIDSGKQSIFYIFTIIEYSHMLIITLLLSTNDIRIIQNATFSSLSNSVLFYLNIVVSLPIKLLFGVVWISTFILVYRGKKLPKFYIVALLYLFYLWQTLLTMLDLLILVSYIFSSANNNYSLIISLAGAASTLLVFIIVIIQTIFYSVEVNYQRKWMKSIVIYVIGFITKLVICIHPKIIDYSIYANAVSIGINLVAVVYITRFFTEKMIIYLPFHVAMLLISVLRISNLEVQTLIRWTMHILLA